MKKSILILFLGFTLFSFSQTTEIPDPLFEQALIDLGIDSTPIDGSVPTANISSLTSLNVNNKNISDLTGIEDFTALTILFCHTNQLTSLDVTNNTALTNLNCYGNELTSIDVTNNTALTVLSADENQLTSLDVTNNTALVTLFCFGSQLTSLDLANNTALTNLECSENQLTSLDVSNNTALTYLFCFGNQITSLDVSNNTALTYLFCFGNQLASLGVSNNTALTNLKCHENQLITLDVRNGNNTNVVDFTAFDNPDLSCILVDDASYSTSNWTDIDDASTFVNDEAECDALSVGDNAFELEVSVYPNPTDDYLFMEGNKNPIFISIYNLLGEKVLSAKKTNKIDVKELSNGVYIIRISDGVSQTDKKFIKN